MVVDFSFVRLDLLQHVLGFELRGSSLLVHDIYSSLLRSDLNIDILELAAEPLRNLTFLGDP